MLAVDRSLEWKALVHDLCVDLAPYPELLISTTPNLLRVEPQTADGFTLTLYRTHNEYIVHYDGWHEHFTSVTDAAISFRFGLSNACRLRILHRGLTAVQWTLEVWVDGTWIYQGRVGLLLTPFWRRRAVTYHQNTLDWKSINHRTRLRDSPPFTPQTSDGEATLEDR